MSDEGFDEGAVGFNFKFTSADFDKRGRDDLLKLFKDFGLQIFSHRSQMGKIKISKFQPALLSAYFRIVYHVKTIEPEIAEKFKGDMYYYDYKHGQYFINAETFFRTIAKEWWEDAYSNVPLSETFYDLRAATYIKRGVFDLPPKYIPVANGVLELYRESNTKQWKIKLVPNSPDLFVIERMPVVYDPKSECIRFNNFLNESVKGDDHMFLQDWSGDMLYRKKTHRRAVMLLGPTRTGKSVLIWILHCLVGNGFSSDIPVEKLNDKYELFRTHGRLLIFHADIETQELKSSGQLLALISADRMSARTLHKPSFDFVPVCVLIYSCNNPPYPYADEPAFWDRWQVVIMNVQQFFPKAK